MTRETDIHVRYAETDQMGIVHHANYFPWFEEARTCFFESLGMSYAELEAQVFYMPLIECSCRFRSPAKYADWVTVRTRVGEMKGATVKLQYEVVLKTDNTVLAEGFTSHVFVDQAFRPVNMKRLRPDVWEALDRCLTEK